MLLLLEKIPSGSKDPLSIKLCIFIGHYRKKIVRPTLFDVSHHCYYEGCLHWSFNHTRRGFKMIVQPHCVKSWTQEHPLTTFKYSTLTYISFLVMMLHNSKSQVTLLLIFPVFWSLSQSMNISRNICICAHNLSTVELGYWLRFILERFLPVTKDLWIG